MPVRILSIGECMVELSPRGDEGPFDLSFAGDTPAILPPEDRRSFFGAVEKARANGALVAFDPNLRPVLWDGDAVMCASVMDAAALSDIVLPSFDDEARFFGDASPDTTADRCAGAGAGIVVVKNGPGAIHAVWNGSRLTVDVPTADRIVDTKAAGDSFNSGVIAGFLTNQSPKDSIRDDLLSHVVEISRKVPFGDPLNKTTNIGAMISRAHLEKVEKYVRAGVDAGAQLLIGGEPQDRDGLFYQPTIFKGLTADMSIMREEIFGPVLSAISFKTRDEAIALANNSEFGLSASVWSTNLENAMQTIRRVRAGRCWIDGVIEMPIGGYKKSGTGRELGRYGFDEYSEFKGLHVTFGRPAPWFQT